MTNGFCYWECRSLPDTLIILGFLGIVIAIIIITAIRIKRIRKFGQQIRNILKIYILILLWGIVLGFQFFYGVSVYFSVIGNRYDVDMDSYSRFYVRLDIIPGFIVQTIFLFICRLFFKGLINTIPISTMAPWEHRLMKTISPYCYFRLLAEGVCILLLNIFAQTEDVKFYLQIAIWVLIIDCVITNFILLASLKIFKVRFRQTNKVIHQDYSKLKRQYTIMIFTSMLRIVIDFFFLIVVPFLDILDSNECLSPFGDHSFRTIAYIGIGNFVNHLIPICWIVKIYSINCEQSAIESHDSSERYNLISSILKSED